MRLDAAPSDIGVTNIIAADTDSNGPRANSSIQLLQTAYDLVCANPEGLNGIVVYGQHSPVLDTLKRSLIKHFQPVQLPSSAGYAELHGGLDSTTTLSKGKLVRHTGLLERSEQTGLLISSVQRLPSYLSSVVCSAIDLKKNSHCPNVVIAFDDSLEQEPGIHASGLAERLAVHVHIPDLSVLDFFSDTDALFNTTESLFDYTRTTKVLSVVPSSVILTDKVLKEFTCLALQLGISSMLPVLNTCRVARTLAAMDGRNAVSEDDALLAVQLALAPHAMHPPQEQAPDDMEDQAPADDQANQPEDDPLEQATQPLDNNEPQSEQSESTDQLPEDAVQDKLVEAAHATLPQHLLASLAQKQARQAETGRDKQSTSIGKSGRPIGILRPKASLSGQRINIIETLKVAVPMQGFRRVEKTGKALSAPNRIHLRKDDLRVTRYRRSSRTTTVFVVDASGSSAMHRLAEAKGAVELLLAECYVRRDRVALITFRGTQATLDLPPTRSLTRAKRALQNLPGGGGTPLASGLQLAYKILSSLSQDGEAPIGVIMTDAKANIALDGTPSRENAAIDAEQQSQLLKTTSARLLFVDTANRRGTQAQKLAKCMNANYLALPRSNSQALPNIISSYAQ